MDRLDRAALRTYLVLSALILQACTSYEADISSKEQAVFSGWTEYTSEEHPPINCDSGSLINDAQCTGSYCDNIRLFCVPTGLTLGQSDFKRYFSDEDGGTFICDDGYWVTGLACTGRYCDNVSLQCSYIGNASNQNVPGHDCKWTSFTSEENGILWFGDGYYARGANCRGDYCDNIRFWVCKL
jgi:hypothetical protein